MGAPRNRPKISVVVISRDEGVWLHRTVRDLEQTLPVGSEIVVVDDGSVDGSADFLGRGRSSTTRGRVRLVRSKGVGVAKARNFGGRTTSGDVLVFADAHLRLPAGWWKPILAALEDESVGAAAPAIRGIDPRHKPGYGLTFRNAAMEVKWLSRRSRIPFEAPILPGCALAMRRDVFEKALGGWDDELMQRGNVDNELSVRLWLLGYRLLIVPDVLVQHRFRRKSPVRVGWPEYLHNRLRLAFAHFSDERLGRVVASLRRYPGFGEALRLISAGDIAARRRELISARRRNDDWYFERFRLHW